MDGTFGVFCGPELIDGLYNSDDAADEGLRSVVESGLFDAWELEVRPVPEDYDLWSRLLGGLRQSRRNDRLTEKEADDAAA